MGETQVGDLPAYLARPLTGEGPWPGLVLVHEAFGLDAVMRRAADRAASLGFLVLAPDLLARGRRITCLARTFATLRRGSGQAFDDIEHARQTLLDDPDCTGRVGVIGFCLGGSFALVLAGRPGWEAAAVNYGDLPSDPASLAEACPVVASYGGRDLYLRGAAGRLEAELSRRGVPHDVREYPDAGHSFLNDADDVPWFAVPPARLVLRAGPEPASAEDAWRRIGDFLTEHLAGRPAD